MSNHINLYSVSSKGEPIKISETNGSLFVIHKTASKKVIKKQYTIMAKEAHQQYTIIYVKKVKHNTQSLQDVFGTYVITPSDTKNPSFVLHEDAVWYHSMDEARKATALVKFDSKYFSTLYSESNFATYTKYPRIEQADKATLQRVVDLVSKKIQINKAKQQNTYRKDTYNATFVQEQLVDALIENHLNPLVTTAQLSARLSALHIVVPIVRSSKRTSDKSLESKKTSTTALQIGTPR